MWIMLWFFLSPAGVLTSGTIEFPTREACEDGRKTWGAMALPLIEKQSPIGGLDAKCIQKRTGKP